VKRARASEIAADTGARQARNIALDQPAFSEPLTQPRERRLIVNGRASELAVLVLAEVKVEVALRELAKPQHFPRLDYLGKNHIGGGLVAAQGKKAD